MKYRIRLNSYMDDVEFEGTLEEAKAYADDCISYNQQDAVIYDEDGTEIARRTWWGVAFDADNDDSENPIDFGPYGYYGDWEEI